MKKEPNGKEYYYLYNGHGDVSHIIDTDGNIVNEYRYDEWGNILSQTEQIKNPFKYAGEIYDAETGLYYLRSRYYDPSIGRFITKDSYEGDIVNPLSLNLYAYCANNPLLYIDPSGHKYVYNRFGEIIGTNVGDDYTDYSQAATNTSGGGDRVYKPWNGGTGSSGTGSVNSSSSVTKSSSGKVAATLIGPPPDARPELLLLFPVGNFGNLIKGTNNIVYISKDPKGVVEYVGITNNLARRAAEHLRSKGIRIEALMKGLSRSDARAVEQVLIEIHGLQKNGGTLMNKINSISISNPKYAQELNRGYELLKSAGYK
ncbi:RHS repeat-associated core domain-containing protein [Desulforamulus ruminis]|uniref:RHS repeat-associated core domain-containing protein n=1 Tax=Desulforamulus ruminis TaxID=1564 RepID=UPI002FD92DC1